MREFETAMPACVHTPTAKSAALKRSRAVAALLSCSVFASAALISAPCLAEESDVAWNGFLNIVGGKFNHEPIVDFESPHQRPSYAGYEKDFAFNPQTSAGLQATKPLDERFSITLQLYAEGDVDHYKADMKWLYLTWQPNYHTRIRIGKLSTPLYYFSDYINVGYAYHWVSPPEPTYPFDSTMTGINVIYQDTWRGFDWTSEFTVGSGDDYFPTLGARASSRNGYGLSFTLSHGEWFTLRAMGLRAKEDLTVDVLDPDHLGPYVEKITRRTLVERGIPQELITSLAPAYASSAMTRLQDDRLYETGVPITYGNLALRLESQRLLFMAELVAYRTDTFLYGNYVSGYVTGGIRFGNTLYHLTAVKGRNGSEREVRADIANNTPVDTSPDAVGDVLASQIRVRIAGIAMRRPEALSLGLRHDVSENIALKFELTRVRERPSFDGDFSGVGYNTLARAALNLTF
ncbi:Hypothetical protein HDN1F_04790 [gamma proteobacterium HdN1]|nr:Hypothetical protein HDN1F_04790 [gamma proteobacterium HdN1]